MTNYDSVICNGPFGPDSPARDGGRCITDTGFVDGDEAFVVSSIDELVVHGCCKLELEDKQWFNADVGVVRWDRWCGGCGYTL